MGQPSAFRSRRGEELVKSQYSDWLRHWPVAKEELTIDTRHGETFVIASGDPGDPPLLLFHGAGANSIMWLPDIATYARNHRVYAVDIIGGANRSETRHPALKGPAYNEWIDDLMAHLGLREAAFVGMSFGGWLCLNYAGDQPERVTRLAILCPGGVVRAKKRFVLKVVLAMGLLGGLGRKWLFHHLLGKDHLDPRLKEYLRLVFVHHKPRRQGIPKIPNHKLTQLYCPVLLILGGKDKIFKPDRILLRLAKQVPQLEVIYRRKSGHFLSEFTREIDRFLATLYPLD